MQEAKQTMALVNKRNIFLETILTVKKKKKLVFVFTKVIKEDCVCFSLKKKR